MARISYLGMAQLAVCTLASMGSLLAFAAAPAASGAEIATAAVELREVDRTYAAEGVIEAVRQSNVAAQVPGRIVELRVDAGQAVVKGQVLARIDEREAAQAVAAGEAQIARAEADLANARVNHERTKRLVEQKFVSQAALDKALADYNSAQAQSEAARAGALQAGAAKSHTVITAPFSGIVSARLVQVGEMAGPGREIVTLYDPKEIRVVASSPQARLGEVRANGPAAAATVELPSLNQWVKGRAVTVLPSADARTHTTLVRVDLPEAVKGAYPGMFARVHFAAGRITRLLIPAAAVVYRSEVAGAYVVGEKGEIRFRQLRLGEPSGSEGIEVLAGVARGERVALDPVAALAQLKRGALTR
jgi:RND family efflux transporter MFP subunit